jgi:hypothetical protein
MLPSKREDHRAALNLNARTPGLIGEDSDAVRERPAVCAHAVSVASGVIAAAAHRLRQEPTAQTSTTAGTPSVPVRHGGRRPQMTSAAAAPGPSPRRTRILASSIETRRTILDLGILVPAGSFQWQANNNADASSRRMPGQGHTLLFQLESWRSHCHIPAMTPARDRIYLPFMGPAASHQPAR